MECICRDCANSTYSPAGICAACIVDNAVWMRLQGKEPWRPSVSQEERERVYRESPDFYELGEQRRLTAKARKDNRFYRGASLYRLMGVK